MRIIMNADDFGLNDNVNEAITYCFAQNKISNTTIMANMGDSSERAIVVAKQNGFFDKVGLHLNLMEGVPMTEKIRHETLFCDENGVFKRIQLSSLKKALPSAVLTRAQREALTEEVNAQMLWYLENGFTEKHLDSHQSVHSWNVILDIVLPLFEKYQFKTMRKRVTRGGNYVIRAYENFVNRKIPEKVVFLGDKYSYLKQPDLLDAARTYEFMVHPVFRDKVCFDDVTGCQIDAIKVENVKMIAYFEL